MSDPATRDFGHRWTTDANMTENEQIALAKRYRAAFKAVHHRPIKSLTHKDGYFLISFPLKRRFGGPTRYHHTDVERMIANLELAGLVKELTDDAETDLEALPWRPA